MGKFPDLNKKNFETILGGLKDDKIKEIVHEKINEILRNKISQHSPHESKLFEGIRRLDINEILKHRDSTVKEFFEKELTPIKETDQVIKNDCHNFLNNITDAKKPFIDFLCDALADWSKLDDLQSNAQTQDPTPKSEMTDVMSTFLFRHDVLFGNLNDLSRLKKDEVDIISAKLDKSLQI